MRSTLVALALLAVSPYIAVAAQAQDARIRVHVKQADQPVPMASVVVNGTTYTTDAMGDVAATMAPGPVEVVVVKAGFAPVTTTITIAAGRQQDVEIDLQPASFAEQVTVSATRTDRRLEDQPMRVEVLAPEEVQEKTMMTPGDIVMMLNETSGMRVQATSPSLGAASVRIQGMQGRYTRFLSDGLPLFGDVGGLGLLQIPPIDLARVEVIKGVASSLYGAGAMGGVVNLVPRRPGKQAEHEVLINRTTRGGTDAVAFYATPLTPHWGVTVMGTGDWQQHTDVNSDGWSDLPGYRRGVLRPRVFWDDGAGRSFFVTTGITVENRKGGTMPGGVLPTTGSPYVEALDTRSYDVGGATQLLLNGAYVLSLRAAAATQHHDHQFGEVLERDRHDTGFGEVTLRGRAGVHTWVTGAALEYAGYRPRDVPRFAYTFTVPGVFAQDDVDIRRWLSISASGRIDHHSEYGTFVSPRIAALFRSGQWSSRLSVGTGFFGPSALTEETEAAGLSRLAVPQPLHAEEGRSGSFDLTRTNGPFTSTVTLFASQVQHPAYVDRSLFTLTNAPQPTTNVGAELVSAFRHEPFTIVANYAFVRSRAYDEGIRVSSPLTPRHSAGVVGMWEQEGTARIGVEAYYTGVQRLEDNPYATESRPYVVVGVLAERRLGPLRLFVNGENLTDVRQTRWQPLIRPERAIDGRWTVDAWAPLEGRNINGGIRATF